MSEELSAVLRVSQEYNSRTANLNVLTRKKSQKERGCATREKRERADHGTYLAVTMYGAQCPESTTEKMGA